MEESHMETGEMKVSYRKSIRESRKTRTAAYCRVSTDENQETSYEAQVAHYTGYITNHEGWELTWPKSSNALAINCIGRKTAVPGNS